jgi:peptidyl-prolyl cis-trans isomerase C
MITAMARHILVKTKKEAEEIREKLRSGGDFAALARKHSTCNSAKRGGDLGEIRPGQLLPSINQVVFKKALNQIHGPVKSKFGYHLVEVYWRD